MGGAYTSFVERQIKARNVRTGGVKTFNVWRSPPPPGQLSGTETVSAVGGMELRRLSKGRYLDLAGDEWVSDAPDAP